ncbi:MAG TPA: hypothetical protein VF264_03595 [Rhodanobacteraceae bacterium]
MDGFWQRLRQRKLVQWSVAYIAAAFAFVQVLDVVAQRFGWPDRLEKLIILALVLGFFVVLVLAWYHGERGAQRVGGTEFTIIVLLLLVGGGALWVYARAPAKSPIAVVTADHPVSPVPVAKPSGAPAAMTEKIPAESVAVLPFANESGRPDERYFSDGLSEDLINALSQFAGLKVISRNSAFQFRDSRDSSAQIGQLLGVAHLLEGSVQRAGDEVRITATLVNASDGSTLWSRQYDKPYKDLFALQDAITAAVAGALKAKLLTTNGAVLQSDRPPSGNLAAYTAYQHGVAYAALGTEADFHRANDAFNAAIRLDPKYAAAYARLSMTWIGLAATGAAKSQEAIANSGQASATALHLDPGSALAHLARALWFGALDMQWSSAAAQAQRALQLAPGDAMAQFVMGNTAAMLGQNQRSIRLTRQALVSDPRHAAWYRWLSVYLTARGQLDAARDAADTAVALQPGAAFNHAQLAVIEIVRGDAKGALAAAKQEPPGVWRNIAVTQALQIGADRAAANAALHDLVSHDAPDAPFQIAEVYALRRDPDAMFQWLDRAWAAHDAGIGYLLFDPFILRYRADPRFAAFCKKVGLPATTDAVAMK